MKERRKGQNYKMKPMWKGNRLRDFYYGHGWGKGVRGHISYKARSFHQIN
jgi:hypothetical protein